MLAEYLISTEWEQCYISNVDEFLAENILHERLVRSSIELLNSYITYSGQHTIKLNLGGCRLEVKGNKQAVATARSLNDALENIPK